VSADKDIANKLENLFDEFSDVFPAELPMEVPPDRGLGDVHKISVEPGSKIPAKAPYRQSPAEQILIK
jgi:hypothetical protein